MKYIAASGWAALESNPQIETDCLGPGRQSKRRVLKKHAGVVMRWCYQHYHTLLCRRFDLIYSPVVLYVTVHDTVV